MVGAVAVPAITIGLFAVAAAVTLDTTPAANGVPLVHAPPVTYIKLPLAPGANEVTAPTPLPTTKLPAVIVATPVPPLATPNVPVTPPLPAALNVTAGTSDDANALNDGVVAPPELGPANTKFAA